MNKIFTTLLCLSLFYVSYAEDGYRLWLRYDKIEDAKLLAQYRRLITGIQSNNASATSDVAKKELLCGLTGIVGYKNSGSKIN